jgi:predicted Fe-Mo cluster-binding NifX family protein
MRICIPTLDNKAGEAAVSEHFGSAPFFTVYDFETKEYEVIDNADSGHEHGMCQPMRRLMGMDIGAIVCRGLGARALQRLNEGGVKVLRTDRSTVKEIVEGFDASSATEISAEDACRDHSCH